MNKNVRSLLIFLVVGLCGLLLYGCATPARVLLNDQDIGSTPATFIVERDKTYKLVLQNEGDGDEREMKIDRGFKLITPLFSPVGLNWSCYITDFTTLSTAKCCFGTQEHRCP